MSHSIRYLILKASQSRGIFLSHRSLAIPSRGSIKKPGSLKRQAKPPPPTISIDDAWEEVTDPAGSGKTYWWNTVTNETTILGAPKPLPQMNTSGTQQIIPGPSNSIAQPVQGGMGSGLLGVVAEGMAFGVGSSLARHAVGAMLGGGSSSSMSSGTDTDTSSSFDSNDSDGDAWDI